MKTYTPTRPIMTRTELAEHQCGAHGRNYAASDDGYGDMEVAAKSGWKPLSSWGRDGWDLGEWPYVIISTKESDGRYLLLSTCEGDHTYYGFDTKEDRDAAIDYLFLWYAAGSRDERDKLDNGEVEVDTKWRGPYRNEGATTVGEEV